MRLFGDKKSKCNVAILGAGHIAESMATAINGCKKDVVAYAVAARDLGRAQAFAKKFGFQKAYGSYDELVCDPDVDLIYIATPHSHHFEHAMLCVSHGKPCLVEKAFTANAKQAEQLLAAASQKGVFITEAMWTRYMPAKDIVKDVMASGVLGDIDCLEADFSIDLRDKARLVEPALAGGALLDLGVYSITFASMYFGDDYASVETTCQKYETGVDGTSEAIYTYPDGKKAILRCSMQQGPINYGAVIGSKGKLTVDNLNNYTNIQRFDASGKLVETYPVPKQVNGYEYELLAAANAIREGKLECEEMPHSQTLEIMRQMDYLRQQWGVVYPFE